MKSLLKSHALAAALTGLFCLAGCSHPEQTSSPSQTVKAVPLTSFSQEITSPIDHFQVKASGSYTLDISVKNTGTQVWPGGGDVNSVTASYRWLTADGKEMPIEGNRTHLDRAALQPGETSSLKLAVTAPPTPGSYTLRVTMVQEGVAWFYSQGAKALDLKASVE